MRHRVLIMADSFQQLREQLASLVLAHGAIIAVGASEHQDAVGPGPQFAHDLNGAWSERDAVVALQSLHAARRDGPDALGKVELAEARQPHRVEAHRLTG